MSIRPRSAAPIARATSTSTTSTCSPAIAPAGRCARCSPKGSTACPARSRPAPPKHLSSAVGQIVNFLGTLQNEWAGAQAFSSFDTYLAPFVRKDQLPYDEVRQCIQELVYNLNVPSRWGTQTPFTNLTFDWTCPDDLREQVPVIGGEEMAFTYGDLQAEMDMINRAYIEVMTAGDAKGRVFTFPIPTYNITPDFPWESENAEPAVRDDGQIRPALFPELPQFRPEAEHGALDVLPPAARSARTVEARQRPVRLGRADRIDRRGDDQLRPSRLSLAAATRRRCSPASTRCSDIGRTSLEIKRKVIQRHMDDGLFPYTRRYLGTLRNHFSTLGVNGINEMIRNFTARRRRHHHANGATPSRCDSSTISARASPRFQEETGHLYNLEATPAEGTTYRFAREDRKRFPGILQAGTPEQPYYTNSSQLPVGFTDDPFEALERQDDLQRKYTGGTVLHLYMGERISSAEACKKLVRRALENFRLPYITVTPTFSICPTHGYIAGEHEFCPICDAELHCAQATPPNEPQARSTCDECHPSRPRTPQHPSALPTKNASAAKSGPG